MTIEITAKKVQDAINQGLEQLGATLDEVEVEVLESGGLFKKAKVRLTLEREEAEEQKAEAPAEKSVVTAPAKEPVKTEQKAPAKNDGEPKQQQQQQRQAQKPAKQKQAASEKPQAQKPRTEATAQTATEKAEKSEKQPEQKKRTLRPEDEAAAKNALEFIQTVIQKMGFDTATVTADASGELVNVSATDGDDSLIIGRHGETLSALSYLAETTARAEKCHINITVDCNGYRDRRAASLTAMAKRRADECAKKHRKIKLEAMERIDRRTVHNALTDDNRVTTASEGKEPHRYVVIIPR